jgi:hypothetical protein
MEALTVGISPNRTPSRRCAAIPIRPQPAPRIKTSRVQDLDGDAPPDRVFSAS